MHITTSVFRLASVILVCALTMGTLAYLHFSQRAPRIAYVDTERLLGSYQAMVNARQTYQREKSEWERNVQTLTEEARQAAEATKGSAGATAARNNLVAAVRIKEQQLLNYRQAVQRQDAEEMQRLTMPVLAHANKYLREYSRVNGYDLLISSSEAGSLVYANPALDVTTQVAAGLNKSLQDSLGRGK